MSQPGVGALTLLVFLTGAASASSGLAQIQQTQDDNCITCHRILGDERLSNPATQFAEDIHAAKGFSCVSCHGGDAAAPGFAGMEPAKGFVGKPEPQQVPEFCGRCHSDAEFMRHYNPALRVDQVAEYVTSVHGRRLMQLGDSQVATCISCHPAHAIKPPSDPNSSVHPLSVAATCGACHADAQYMEAYPIATDQRDKYERSVHWETMSVKRDLSAPTCNDCHGNHGAAPPGISWVGNVCGQCHSVMADFFAESAHARTFPLLGMPGCATCHGNHQIEQASDELLGLGDGAVCRRCHTAGDPGGQAATTMRALLDTLRLDFEGAEAILLQAEHAGMEVSEAQFELGGANNAQVKARAAVHTFDVEAVRKEVEQGLEITTKANARGQRALDDLRFRRMGLAVSVTIILVLIGGLLLKIRKIERQT